MALADGGPDGNTCFPKKQLLIAFESLALTFKLLWLICTWNVSLTTRWKTDGFTKPWASRYSATRCWWQPFECVRKNCWCTYGEKNFKRWRYACRDIANDAWWSWYDSGIYRKCILVSWWYWRTIVSQYLLQIVKCLKTLRCAFRTSWMQVFPDRFLPDPLLVRVTPKGPLYSRAKWCQKYRQILAQICKVVSADLAILICHPLLLLVVTVNKTHVSCQNTHSNIAGDTSDDTEDFICAQVHNMLTRRCFVSNSRWYGEPEWSPTCKSQSLLHFKVALGRLVKTYRPVGLLNRFA